MGAVLRSLGYSYNSTDPQQLKQAYQKLVELKPAIASFTSDAWRNQILTGDLLIAMSYSPDAIEVTEENPRLKYVIPQSGTSVWTDTMVIPKTAPNPDGAYAWINYILQPSVAAQFCKRLHFATPNRAVFDQLPVELRNDPYLFPPDSQLTRSERIAPLWDFTEVYEHYWTQLTSS
jgi:spermidine/putrescine transport system substrate-binding protein